MFESNYFPLLFHAANIAQIAIFRNFALYILLENAELIEHANEETIRKAIKDARKAQNVIFYWESDIEKMEDLRNAVIREVGRMKKLNRLHEMPDIYYIDKLGLLRTAWKK
jgi:hypothetical protein